MARVRVATMALCLFGVLGAVAPALASAGSISGVVTAAEGGGPIGSVEVCARIEPMTIEEACTTTDGAGAYSVGGLPAGSYKVRFRETQNRNYVDQYFDGKVEFSAAELVTIGATENRTGVSAAMQPGGSIAGTVTDAGSAAPVAGFLVCAFATTALGGEVGRCGRSDGSGAYKINGLPPEDYKVEFLSEDEFNYLTQYYDGVDTLAAASLVTVILNDVAVDIDAALLPGVEISGTLTEVGTGKPLAGVDVSLLEAGTERALGFPAETDAAGRYAFRGRPTGAYVVGFSHTLGGPFNGDCYSAQYYKGSASFAGATPLSVTAPSVIPGIDGEVVNLCPKTGPQPVQVTFVPADPPPPPLKCKKNQRKKWVKGKYRCVKKPKKHKKKHHGKKGRGPQAVATER